MAQTGFTPLQIYHSNTSGTVPTAGNLLEGELAMNLADRKMFTKTSGGTVIPIGGGATGGGSDSVFYENGQTVNNNYTITTSNNAMSTGPITIASGKTVTIPSGSRWVIL